MDIIYVVIIVVAALVYGYAAMLNFVGAESVKVVADRVRVSQKWMIPFGVLLASGALGLLIGLAVPVVGIAAATGLVVYFVGALIAHIRIDDRGVGGAIGFLLLALVILALEIAYHKAGASHFQTSRDSNPASVMRGSSIGPLIPLISSGWCSASTNPR